MLIVTGEIQEMHPGIYMGWVHQFKALVVQGKSKDDVKKELLISLRAKLAYDYGISISNIESEEVVNENLERFKQLENENDFKLELA